jgi:hypothetical protein
MLRGKGAQQVRESSDHRTDTIGEGRQSFEGEIHRAFDLLPRVELSSWRGQPLEIDRYIHVERPVPQASSEELNLFLDHWGERFALAGLRREGVSVINRRLHLTCGAGCRANEGRAASTVPPEIQSECRLSLAVF